jgi:transcriptional regulator with XRE-family HTH domain
MFKEKFIRLCNERGEPPTVVCQKIGVTSSAFSKWTDESVPRKATLMRIADYFGVSVDYLLGNVQLDLQHFAEKEKEPSPTLDPRLLSLLDSMDADQLAEIEQYAEFILNKKKGSDK